MKPQELADYFDYELEDVFPYCTDTINMLRQLAQLQKPLTNEEIYDIWKKAMQEEAKVEYSIYATQLERQPFIYFARAIEAKLKGQ
jgi:hypothetical protein